MVCERHSSDSPSIVFPPFKETTSLPSYQNFTRSKPPGHANSAAADSSGWWDEEIKPRMASSQGQSRRSRLSIASPNLTTLQARGEQKNTGRGEGESDSV